MAKIVKDHGIQAEYVKRSSWISVEDSHDEIRIRAEKNRAYRNRSAIAGERIITK